MEKFGNGKGVEKGDGNGREKKEEELEEFREAQHTLFPTQHA